MKGGHIKALDAQLREVQISMQHSAGTHMVPGWDGYKVAGLLSDAQAELSRLRADADDATRYRAFFDAGLPITFLGESFYTKADLDAAIDRARSAAQGGSDV